MKRRNSDDVTMAVQASSEIGLDPVIEHLLVDIGQLRASNRMDDHGSRSRARRVRWIRADIIAIRLLRQAGAPEIEASMLRDQRDLARRRQRMLADRVRELEDELADVREGVAT